MNRSQVLPDFGYEASQLTDAVILSLLLRLDRARKGYALPAVNPDRNLSQNGALAEQALVASEVIDPAVLGRPVIPHRDITRRPPPPHRVVQRRREGLEQAEQAVRIIPPDDGAGESAQHQG